MAESVKDKLLEYQKPHLDNLVYSLETYGRVLDTSDTGTGKTFTAVAACLKLNKKPLIVCPKAVLSGWKKVLDTLKCKYYGVTNYESFQNCKMYTAMSKWDKVKCLWLKRSLVKNDSKETKSGDSKSKDLNSGNLKPNEGVKKKKKPQKDSPFFKFLQPKDEEGKEMDVLYRWENFPKDIIVIFDEAHKCKNHSTTNHQILQTIAKTDTPIMLLSATIADKPDTFPIAGYVLKLYPQLRLAKNWIDGAGIGYENPMVGVHKAIHPELMCRMRIKDLGDLFPENQVKADCYDMDCAKEIQEQYQLIDKEVEKLKNKEHSSECPLAIILYARMRIEQLKVPTIISQAKKFLEEKNSVAIFVNFTASLKLIAQELKTNCVIFGEQTLEERNKNVTNFNEDKCQAIVVNIRSGGAGISLHDTNGIYPRVSIISPSWSAQDILQALGRIHRANGKTAVRQRIIYCKGTIEEAICERMVDKIMNISSINDGDVNSYQIEGLTKESDVKDMTEFEITFHKINTLHAKKERLEKEIKTTEEEIKNLEQIMGYLIL